MWYLKCQKGCHTGHHWYDERWQAARAAEKFRREGWVTWLRWVKA